MLDADVILNSKFELDLKLEFSFWDIQAYEWNRIQGKNVLRNWWMDGRYRSREALVGIQSHRQYSVQVIKKFPTDWMFRSEWIGDQEQKSKTNVLHVPTGGMMIRFKGQEVLRVATLCSNEIQVAVRDTLRTCTRMCKSCDKVQTRLDREAARAAKGPFHCTACGASDHNPSECTSSPDPEMQKRLEHGEVTTAERRRGWKEVG